MLLRDEWAGERIGAERARGGIRTPIRGSSLRTRRWLMPAVRSGPPLRVFWRMHRAFMRLTGGRFGRVGAMDAPLLTTKGRKSGERSRVVAQPPVRPSGRGHRRGQTCEGARA